MTRSENQNSLLVDSNSKNNSYQTFQSIYSPTLLAVGIIFLSMLVLIVTSWYAGYLSSVPIDTRPVAEAPSNFFTLVADSLILLIFTLVFLGGPLSATLWRRGLKINFANRTITVWRGPFFPVFSSQFVLDDFSEVYFCTSSFTTFNEVRQYGHQQLDGYRVFLAGGFGREPIPVLAALTKKGIERKAEILGEALNLKISNPSEGKSRINTLKSLN